MFTSEGQARRECRWAEKQERRKGQVEGKGGRKVIRNGTHEATFTRSG